MIIISHHTSIDIRYNYTNFPLFFCCRNSAKRQQHVKKISQEVLTKKKTELISQISTKLEVLRSEMSTLKSETKTNEEIGRKISVKVMQVAQPNECEKYKLHVEEIDKITSLLLGLAGRLARAENTFVLCTENSAEKVRIFFN
jgi:hypothetical protein